MIVDNVKCGLRNRVNGFGGVGKVVASGHDTKKIGFAKIIDDATIMELFFTSFQILSFTKLMGYDDVTRKGGD